MLIVIVFYSGCEVINFKINFMFLIKPFFLHGEKVKKKKKLNILRTNMSFNFRSSSPSHLRGCSL